MNGLGLLGPTTLRPSLFWLQMPCAPTHIHLSREICHRCTSISLPVVLGINSMSDGGSNFHEAKPSEIFCITCSISIGNHMGLSAIWKKIARQ